MADVTRTPIPQKVHRWQGGPTDARDGAVPSVVSRCYPWLFFAFAFHLALPCLLKAEETTADRDADICKSVIIALEQKHMGPAPMPSEFDQAVVDCYLRKLDPRKMYFHQADVDRFRQNATDLQRQLRRGDVSWMNDVLSIYHRRVREYDAVARRFADAELDFTIDETIDLDFPNKPYAVSVVESHDRWRKWTKYELLACRLPGETMNQKRRRMKKWYTRFFNQVVTADRDDEMEDFLNVVVKVFVTGSGYMSPKTVDSFKI